MLAFLFFLFKFCLSYSVVMGTQEILVFVKWFNVYECD